MSAQKRKRNNFTLKGKKEIIDTAKREPNQFKSARDISKKWGFEVNRTTVKDIFSKKDAIEAAIKASVSSKRIKLTQAHNPKFDEGVLIWPKQAREQREGEGDETLRADAYSGLHGKRRLVRQF